MNQYIITEEDIHCLFDYFQAALDGEENKKALKRLFDQQCGVMRSHPYQSERDTVLERLHIWFENYCEGNEDPDLWMAFLHAERTLRQAGEP